MCVDCDKEYPEWAAVNHGIVMCIECSGIHRNLGTHISQVRSLFLDSLSSEQLNRLITVGNKRFNYLRENSFLKCIKPGPEDTRTVKETFIVRKYKNYLERESMEHMI